MSNFLPAYLKDLNQVHQSGKATDERSYYGPLNTLFTAIGATLTPQVKPIQDVAAEGKSGHPDFLLQAANNKEVRVAVEVKGAAADLDATIGSDQVGKYLEQYGLCLVTNLREFALVEGNKTDRHTFMKLTLAPSEAEFWQQQPKAAEAAYGQQFDDLLLNALTWGAPITSPADLAAILASYAHDALRQLEKQPSEKLPALRDALKAALGLSFEDEQGEHFFRSSLVQTVFYGLFSAWVAYNKRGAAKTEFTWSTASDHLGLPLLAYLFDAIAQTRQMSDMKVREPLEWAEAALKRTKWEAFEQGFKGSEAINYFYEPFLASFDPQLRKQLGVWYTPTEIVRYMVERVDTVLREELGVADGLADERVVVLDPCCGTGAYPIEVLRFIAKRLKEQGKEWLIGAALSKAASKRVYGFEIMPAPFVIAHLQIGMLLAEFGGGFGEDQRAGVYLTNALTGWEKEKATTLNLPGFPTLQKESEESQRVKQQEQILVILGNPPYNGYAGVAVAEEKDLIKTYLAPKRAPKPQGRGLNDLYVRFFRMAEQKIVERTGRGVISFISNYSWLDGLSHTGMRERYMDAFDKIYIDNLNGDKYRTGKTTPEGKPDPSAFSTPSNPEGIQVGTAIATMVRCDTHKVADTVHIRHFWGSDKRDQLSKAADLAYTELLPTVEIGYPFSLGSAGIDHDYLAWLKLPELFPTHYSGVITSRDDLVVDIDEDRLRERIKRYFDPALSHEQVRQTIPSAMESSPHFQAETVRAQLLKRGLLPKGFVRYCYRPFDVRWMYWEPETKLLTSRSPNYFPQIFAGNLCLVSQQKPRREWSTPQVIRSMGCRDLMDRGASCFPLWLQPKPGNITADMIDNMVNGQESAQQRLNLSNSANNYLAKLGVSGSAGSDLFYHALAVMHAPAYRTENTGALRQDWPRIPLPATQAALAASAALGRQIAALLDTEKPVAGVSAGDIRSELRGIGKPSRVGGGSISDFEVKARWGHAGRSGITMPSTGTVKVRPLSSDELAAIGSTLLGDSTYDVHLNAEGYWANIPQRVWEYTMGGYQVIKKWLSYREVALLKRPLTSDEVEEVTNIARRIAAILLLEPALDGNYGSVKAAVVGLPK
jgi:hypothetical protein